VPTAARQKAMAAATIELKSVPLESMLASVCASSALISSAGVSDPPAVVESTSFISASETYIVLSGSTPGTSRISSGSATGYRTGRLTCSRVRHGLQDDLATRSRRSGRLGRHDQVLRKRRRSSHTDRMPVPRPPVRLSLQRPPCHPRAACRPPGKNRMFVVKLFPASRTLFHMFGVQASACPSKNTIASSKPRDAHIMRSTILYSRRE